MLASHMACRPLTQIKSTLTCLRSSRHEHHCWRCRPLLHSLISGPRYEARIWSRLLSQAGTIHVTFSRLNVHAATARHTGAQPTRDGSAARAAQGRTRAIL
jgi:hypothetical protein